VIDWDLEAPGLHRYFQPFLTDKELTGQESQGVIDMAIDFAVRAATPSKDKESDSKWYEAYADFSKWRHKLRWPSGEAIRLGKDGRGEIDFVPAGRQGPEYSKRVNHFDWRHFYEKLGGGAFFDAAKRKLDAYDYVLIDSRTGVSDTSGICTLQMPDTLVVCFTLNYQSIDGACAVARSVREQNPDIRIFPVPMRVDSSEEKLLNRMKNYAVKTFGPLLSSTVDAERYWYSMEVPYFARYAYAEKLALFEEQASITASTLPAMERLSAYLTDGEVRNAGVLPESQRTLALAEFEGISKGAEPSTAAKRPLVIGVQSTGTSVPWYFELRPLLEQEGFVVESASYDYGSVLRFLMPSFFARGIVDHVAKQIRYAREVHEVEECSVIASGFGTFVIARILRDHPDLVFSRIIFAGSVVSYSFEFSEVMSRFKAPLINEIGSRDYWPAIVASVTFGYGPSGTYGFHRSGIVDRWHDVSHTNFLTQQFCRRYWVPFLTDGRIVEGAEKPKQPPWWLQVLSTVKVKYMLLLLLVGVSVGFWYWVIQVLLRLISAK
jgi:hypothetical protein